MKNLSKLSFLVLGISLLSNPIIAQHGGHKGGKHNNTVKVKNGRNNKVIVKNGKHNSNVVIRRSKYRPAKITVYNPRWNPKRNFNRRWVYFPRYNFYWDNWRNVYVYRNNNIWITNTNPPPVIINIDINTEKNYELNDSDDDTDDVYKVNENHKKVYVEK